MSREMQVPDFVYWLGAPFLLAKLAAQKRTGVFKPLELLLIESIISQAPNLLIDPLRSQVAEINHALRVTGVYTEVNFFKIVGIRPDNNRTMLLPVAPGEIMLGVVKLPKDQSQFQQSSTR
jgi:hypothetical protein